MTNQENSPTKIDERVVLSKFEGEPLPENEIERIHIYNGEIVQIEKIEDGEVVEVFKAENGQFVLEEGV